MHHLGLGCGLLVLQKGTVLLQKFIQVIPERPPDLPMLKQQVILL